MIKTREIAEVRRTGSLQQLKIRQDELPPPQDNEVQVKIHSIGLNFADIFAIYGIYSATPKPPFVPGLEFSGEITAVGSQVKEKKPGDMVMGATRFGAYATALNQDQNYIFPLPKDWTPEQGASFPVQALTAYYALVVLGECHEGQNVLIQSAAGGVGLYANQLAKKIGAHTIGCVGSANKLDTLQKYGFDHSMVRSRHFKNNMKEILGERSLSLVLECIGGQIFQESYDLLSPMGRLITYGSANFTPTSNYLNPITTLWKYIHRPKIDPLKMISDNKAIMGFNLIWLWDRKELLKEYMNDLLKYNLTPHEIGLVYDWKDIHKALIEFRSGSTIGKVIIRI